MHFSEFTHDLAHARKLDQLIHFAEEAMRTMHPDVVRRLRTSTEQFITQNYGRDSTFYSNYRDIDSWSSQYNLQEIKGLLQAMKDDIEDSQGTSTTHFSTPQQLDESDPMIHQLTGILLELFYTNVHYNRQAIENLITLDSNYFEYRLQDALAIYQKFIDRKIIAYIGIGQAFCITEQGRKLYERKYTKKNPSFHQPIDSNNQAFPFDVFICHASIDKPLLQSVLADFQRLSISYWLDEDQIRPGDNIINKLSEGLQQCRFVLICISNNQLGSIWSQYEYQSMLTSILSKQSEQILLPFVHDDIQEKDIPTFLQPIRRIRKSKSEEYQQLLTFLAKKV